MRMQWGCSSLNGFLHPSRTFCEQGRNSTVDMDRKVAFLVIFCCLILLGCAEGAAQELNPAFYDTSCPNAQSIVYQVVRKAVKRDKRMAASLLRLHFHDCFVNGCDGSVLLDDTPTFRGEKTALPNANSLRGFEVVDNIKAALEKACPGVVSCADILAIAAQVSVHLRAGPSWTVYLGRRDSLSASRARANNDIPPPTSSVSALVAFFQRQDLSLQDMVVLSGSHTIGLARCVTFNQRIYNHSGTHRPDPEFGKQLLIRSRIHCPRFGHGNVTQPLDFETPNRFDNYYYQNLLDKNGLLNSDQVLTYQSPVTAALVKQFSYDQQGFFREFASSMIKMGNIKPLTGENGEIRRNCRVVNSQLVN